MPTCSRRPSTTRTRRAILISPDAGHSSTRCNCRRWNERLKRIAARENRAASHRQRRGADQVHTISNEAVELSNRIAPEHLELSVASPRKWLEQVRHAGAVFLGHATRRRPSATTAPDPTTCCRLRARHASPIRWVCTNSRSAHQPDRSAPEGAKSLASIAGRIADAGGLQARPARATGPS